MNSVIWKYPLEVTTVAQLEIPEGADILCVKVQNGKPTLWVAVDCAAKKVSRTFIIHGTGHLISNYNKKIYIGTFFYMESLVFHVFELLQDKEQK